MPVRTAIIDGRGSGQLVGATPLGELLVAGFGNLVNISSYQLLNANNAAFNFFLPIPGQQFIITSIICDGAANATQTIFSASNPSTTTVNTLLLKFNFRAAGQIAITLPFGGFIPVPEGDYVNALTDGQPVNMNIIGYYHPILTTPP